ncbi:25026_t:CDS:2 [Gigaspora rosea]|nr:25026_t:CDS:2 [Gigaspora rosea]
MATRLDYIFIDANYGHYVKKSRSDQGSPEHHKLFKVGPLQMQDPIRAFRPQLLPEKEIK